MDELTIEPDCDDEQRTDIVHTTGYKDDYLVKSQFGSQTDSWAPTNEEIFTLVDKWFESEDHEFGDGYGRMMPLFYVCLIAIGHEEKAMEACEKRGYDALRHFESCLDAHRDEVIQALEDI